MEKGYLLPASDSAPKHRRSKIPAALLTFILLIPILALTLPRVFSTFFDTSIPFIHTTFPLLAPTPPKGPIDWHLCEPSNTRFECGRIKVPLNYLNKSDERKVELAVGRYLSVNPKRMGSVFINPGGPGGSGLSFLYRAGPQLSQMLDGAYDIVSWDPRGVNGSLPNALCHTSKKAQDIYNLQFSRPLEFNNLTAEASDPLPSEDISILKHQFRELWAQTSLYASLCNINTLPSPEYESGFDLFSHYGTASVVRDLEHLSSLIEGPSSPVNYAGFSYGTEIGAVFVGMFPERVGRVWIDGVVDPVVWAEVPEYKSASTYLVDTDKALNDFFQKCIDAGLERCALATNSTKSAAKLEKKILGLIKDIYHGPLPVPHAKNPGLLRSGHIRDAIFEAMYRPRSWPDLAEKLAATLEGNGAPILESQSPTLDPTAPPDSFFPILQGVRCADGPPVHRLLDEARRRRDQGSEGEGKDGEEEFMEEIVKELVDEVEKAYSETSKTFATTVSSPACFHWRLNPPERWVGPWDKRLAGPILIVGNTADPITPLKNAKVVNELLRNDSRLIIQDGSGHCSLAQVSLCTGKIVREYFLEGKLPQNGKVCNVTEILFPPLPKLAGTTSVSITSTSGEDLDGGVWVDAEEFKTMSEEDVKLLEAMKGIGEAIQWEWNPKQLRVIGGSR